MPCPFFYTKQYKRGTGILAGCREAILSPRSDFKGCDVSRAARMGFRSRAFP
jgi:hypothetical protein